MYNIVTNLLQKGMKMNKIIINISKNIINNKRKVYILRRVVFVFIIIVVLLSLILCIFKPKDSPVSSINEENSITNFPTPTNLVATEPSPTEEPISILIYHTHNDEAYFKGNKKYFETDLGRTFDEKYNIIAVGDALKKQLEKYGFMVDHDKSDNVSDGFDYAYDTSLKNIKKLGKNYDIYIDLHRDAYVAQSGKNFAKKLNKEYAFVRLVVANGTNYKQKPNYKENYSYAEKLTNEMNLMFPGIARDVFIKKARLNQHLSNKCILIEIGNEKNDLQQAINSTEVIANAISKIS